jgi:hypothetical protein
MNYTSRIWPYLMFSSMLAGCGSIIESYGTESGVANITYISTEKVKVQDIAHAFRQFASREQLNCSRPINAPRDILDSCDGQGGMYITMFQESHRLKFLTQTLLMSQNADKAKAGSKALSIRLANDLRSKFGDAVEAQ